MLHRRDLKELGGSRPYRHTKTLSRKGYVKPSYKDGVSNPKFPMNSVNVNQFQANIKQFIEQVIKQHLPLKVKGTNGQDFIVISAEDWEQQQETLYILQNSSLIQQIADSTITHTHRKGYSPTDEELDEIISI